MLVKKGFPTVFTPLSFAYFEMFRPWVPKTFWILIFEEKSVFHIWPYILLTFRFVLFVFVNRLQDINNSPFTTL